MPLYRRAPSRALLVAGLSFAAWAASTCSATSDFQSGSASSWASGSGNSGSNSSNGGGPPDEDGGPNFSANGSGGYGPDGPCGLITEEAKTTPLNLYITFDKSSSMAGNKWTSAKAGLSAFVNDPASAGVTVALNFFPLDNNPTCDQFAYKPPVVAFDLLPQNAGPVEKALEMTTPNGFLTPMYPALGGAILAAKDQSQKNPGESAAVLLITDGQPQGPADSCAGVNPEDPKAIAALAKTGTMFGIKTFVIGLPGVAQATANQIALAGGSGAAILVGSIDVQSEFQVALAKVRGQAVPCEYDLPDKVTEGQIGIGYVNVLLTPKSGETSVLPQNPGCAGAGWKYDDPTKPDHISFCPQSCDASRQTSARRCRSSSAARPRW